MAPMMSRRVSHVAALVAAAVVAVAAVSATLWLRAQHAGPALPAIDPSPVHRVVVTANRLPPVEQQRPTVHRVVVTAPRLPQPQTVAADAGTSASRPL